MFFWVEFMRIGVRERPSTRFLNALQLRKAGLTVACTWVSWNAAAAKRIACSCTKHVVSRSTCAQL